MPVQYFGDLSRKILGAKACRIWDNDFERLQSSTAHISGTDKDIQNRASTFSTTIPPMLCEKSLVNFDPIMSKN